MRKSGFRHIRSRLFAAFIVMTVLTVIILWFVQAGLLGDSYIQNKIKSVEAALMTGDLDQETITAIEEKTAASLVVIKDDGSILYRSQGIPMMGVMLKAANDMMPLTSQSQVEYISTSHSGIRYAVLGYPSSSDTSVFAVFSLADADEAARLLRQQLWLITLTLIILSILLAMFLSRRFSEPIQALTTAARQIAAGNMNIRIDVTSNDEIGQLTEALNDMSQRLKENDQLQKELIANVSHELKSPLTIIKGYAQTVRDISWPDQTKRTSHLNLISSEADRLGRIVQDILDYSRLQAGIYKPALTKFPVMNVLSSISERLEHIAAQRSVKIELSGEEAMIVFDRDRFEQVCLNLVQNAVQHAYTASTVNIQMKKFINSEYRQEILHIEISNFGDTIPEDELSKIWDRYYRSGQVNSDQIIGTGLGLAIVRSILEAHHCSYGVSSQNGHTVFWFDLVI